MTDEELKSTALKALFTTWKPTAKEIGESEAERKTGLAELIGVYRMAIEDLPGWAVQRAVKAFIKNKVGSHNTAFRPRAPEIAKEAEAQIFLECESQNAQIVYEQKRLSNDGQRAYWRHRRDELVTPDTVDPSKLPAIPHEDFQMLLEHGVDPAMQAKLAKIIPLSPATQREAG
jgi:hypothetical protein